MGNEDQNQIKFNLHARNVLVTAASQETNLKPTKNVRGLD